MGKQNPLLRSIPGIYESFVHDTPNAGKLLEKFLSFTRQIARHSLR